MDLQDDFDGDAPMVDEAQLGSHPEFVPRRSRRGEFGDLTVRELCDDLEIDAGEELDGEDCSLPEDASDDIRPFVPADVDPAHYDSDEDWNEPGGCEPEIVAIPPTALSRSVLPSDHRKSRQKRQKRRNRVPPGSRPCVDVRRSYHPTLVNGVPNPRRFAYYDGQIKDSTMNSLCPSDRERMDSIPGLTDAWTCQYDQTLERDPPQYRYPPLRDFAYWSEKVFRLIEDIEDMVISKMTYKRKYRKIRFCDKLSLRVSNELFLAFRGHYANCYFPPTRVRTKKYLCPVGLKDVPETRVTIWFYAKNLEMVPLKTPFWWLQKGRDKSGRMLRAECHRLGLQYEWRKKTMSLSFQYAIKMWDRDSQLWGSY